MLAKVYSGAHTGYKSRLVEVECDISQGLPTLQIVGLGTKAVDEAKERVRGAIKNSGLVMPSKRITVNLAPADLVKEGTAYDLPIAIAILIASGQIKQDSVSKLLLVGELALDGNLRSIPGALSFAELARQKHYGLAVPSTSAREASLIDDVAVLPAQSLLELYEHLNGERAIKPVDPFALDTVTLEADNAMSDIHGQEHAKRALEIAAAGHHNILLTGPPGTGKTMLAKALHSILPLPSREEIIEINKTHSLAGMLNDDTMLERPFRNPHHTASNISLIGGGKYARPGEISLAHRGVLFLDEIPEFPRHVLEALRQPLEDRVITVSRADRSALYPADIMLVATQNPCPCGYHLDQERECICSTTQILQYKKRLSGPLMDRIDMVVPVQRIEKQKLLKPAEAEPSHVIAKRVETARERQAERFGSRKKNNASMSNAEIRRFCQLSAESESLLEVALEKLQLSPRALMRILKVSRTIADLGGDPEIKPSHLSEALQYRPVLETY